MLRDGDSLGQLGVCTTHAVQPYITVDRTPVRSCNQDMQPHSEVRRRRRRVLSCMACRRRKIKCNREHPCQHCTETQQVCNYQAPPSPQLWQAAKVVERPPPQNQNSWRSVIFSSGSNTPDSFGEAPVHHEAAPVPPTLLQSPPASQPTPAAVSSADRRPEPQNDSFVAHLPKRDDRIFARKSAVHDSQIVLDKTRILRWSHWMGAGQEVCDTIMPHSFIMIEN